jgi:dienelactone hydrolase
MIEEVNRRFSVETDRLFLHGFSAGGQFVHRFFYLYPEKVQALSIGSSGWVTFLDHSLPWPDGLQGFKEIFGRDPNIELLQKVKVQMVIGGDDDFIYRKDSPYTRMELNTKLKDNFLDQGIDTTFTIIPNVSHQGLKIISGAMDFFAAVMGVPWDGEVKK